MAPRAPHTAAIAAARAGMRSMSRPPAAALTARRRRAWGPAGGRGGRPPSDPRRSASFAAHCRPVDLVEQAAEAAADLGAAAAYPDQTVDKGRPDDPVNGDRHGGEARPLVGPGIV